MTENAMHDIRFIRENPDDLRPRACAARASRRRRSG